MFNEQKEEWSKKSQSNIPVWQSPKYLEAKSKAIELINSGKYDLVEGDFWILMNETKTGKMQYTGLIISHNGCLKINDKIDNKVKPEKFDYVDCGYNDSLIFTYCDDELFEVGEVSKDNCKNDYPYAMAFKRCFDRVVLKKCKLAYAGVYSDSEADEFTGKDIEMQIPTINENMETTLRNKIKELKLDNQFVLDLLGSYGYEKLAEIKVPDYKEIFEKLGDKQ